MIYLLRAHRIKCETKTEGIVKGLSILTPDSVTQNRSRYFN